MSISLHRTRFFTTVNDLHDLPATGLPEVAFAGRSNAGKSSAINVLCGQKRLAFHSKTPGRTQHINYFAVNASHMPATTAGYLVDLPGYGYAKVPLDTKAYWGKLLAGYLQHRQPLHGLILLMDARHPCTALDTQMLAWFVPTGRPVHILLTKSDKLTRQAGMRALQTTQCILDKYAATARAPLTVQLFSALKRTGLDQAHGVLEAWFAPPAAGLPGTD